MKHIAYILAFLLLSTVWLTTVGCSFRGNPDNHTDVYGRLQKVEYVGRGGDYTYASITFEDGRNFLLRIGSGKTYEFNVGSVNRIKFDDKGFILDVGVLHEETQ